MGRTIAKAKKKQEKEYANSEAGKRDPAYRHYHQYKTQDEEEVFFNYGDIGGNIIVNPKSTIEDQIAELLSREPYNISAMEFDPSKIEITTPDQTNQDANFAKTQNARNTPKESVLKEESGIHKFNKEDPNNPEVVIQGYGTLLLNQIEDDLVRNFNSLEHMAKRKEWDGIDYQLNKTGVMQAKLEAIISTKEQLQAIRRKGGPKSRGITKESLYDILIGEDKEMGALDESFEKLSRKFQVARHNKAYKRAADTLHEVLKRKYQENEGNWRHALGWYVAKIASGFNGVKTRVLEDYYLENYESAFIESVTEAGGVGKVVPGVNTSVDVGPNEIKTQAKKFGNDVDKDGVPKKNLR